MRQFKWNDWNLQKIANHGLGKDEVEAAFDLAEDQDNRSDGSHVLYAFTPSGRRIEVVWRYDRDAEEIPDIFGVIPKPPIFVVTAY